MRIGSVKHILTEGYAAVMRFPFVFALCAAGCLLAWTLVDAPKNEDDLRVVLLLTSTFGAVLFYGLQLMGERFPLPAPVRPAHFYAAGGILLGFFYYFFAARLRLDFGDRYAQWMLTALLFVTFARCFGKEGQDGFWQFNRHLVVRGVISAVYTGVLFAGISLALRAVDQLLGVEIQDKVYGYMWIFAGYMFWPLHFMGGTPPVTAADPGYPRGLKVFTQYVLLPLATVYFLILYVYMGKILATQQWPQGWVSWLTSSASLLGLLAFMLLYPVSDEEGNGWIRRFSRGFCLAALPLLLMLFSAVYKRVAQYGLTEHRYFLICLGAWLFGIFIYFLLSRRPDIRKVPMSAAALLLAVSVGPWGAYAMSLNSQTARLESLLSDNGLLKDGRAVKLENELDSETRRQMSAVLDYILRHHGAAPIARYFPEDLLPGAPPNAARDKASKDIMSYLGQEYVGKWMGSGARYIRARADSSGCDAGGYGLAVQFSVYRGKRDLPADGDYGARLQREGSVLRVFRGGRLMADVELGNVLVEVAKSGGAGPLSQEKLCAVSGGSAGIKACFSRVSAERGDGGVLKMTSGSGLLLVKREQ